MSAVIDFIMSPVFGLKKWRVLGPYNPSSMFYGRYLHADLSKDKEVPACMTKELQIYHTKKTYFPLHESFARRETRSTFSAALKLSVKYMNILMSIDLRGKRYYTLPGIILDSEMRPLLCVMHEYNEGGSIIGQKLRISPRAWDSKDVMEKSIVQKVIPEVLGYTIPNNVDLTVIPELIGLRGKKMSIVISDEIDDVVGKAVQPSADGPTKEEIHKILVDNIDFIL